MGQDVAADRFGNGAEHGRGAGVGADLVDDYYGNLQVLSQLGELQQVLVECLPYHARTHAPTHARTQRNTKHTHSLTVISPEHVRSTLARSSH